jgi:MFS family permease
MVGSVYPWIFLSYGLSATVGPPVAGLLYDVIGNYKLPIIIATVVCVLGAVFGYWTLPVPNPARNETLSSSPRSTSISS